MTPAPVPLAWPFRRPFRVLNSPGSRVPSHGTSRLALSYAIDLVPVDETGASGPITLRTLFATEDPTGFVGMGEPVIAPVSGTVVATHDGEPDHRTHRGLASLAYMVTQGGRLRRGYGAVAGNHVIVEVADRPGTFVALCHLRANSLAVGVGDTVEAGETVVGTCGISGNSTEPHLHLQAMTDPDPTRAEALPITFPAGLPRNGDVVRP